MNTKTIWKFTIDNILEPVKFKIPEASNILRVAPQGRSIAMWFCVCPELPLEERMFFVSGTGHPVEMSATYMGSASFPPMEWHVWERNEQRKAPGAP